jgi:hypothetical protein
MIFDPSYSYLAPPIVDSYVYYFTDPPIQDVFSPFVSSRPYLSPVHSLAYQDPNYPMDNEIFNFDPLKLKFTISSMAVTSLGTYKFYFQAIFNRTEIVYKNVAPFQVTILHYCLRSVIQAPAPLPDQEYQITDPALIIQLAQWSLSLASCGPLTFTATQSDGTSLPKYVKFDAKAVKLSVFTISERDLKTTEIVVKASAQYYSPESDLATRIKLNVVCELKRIMAQTKSKTYSLIIGSMAPL